MPTPAPSSLRPFTRFLIILLGLAPLALAVPVLMDPEPELGEAPDEPAPALPARPRGQRMTVDQARPLLGFAINAHHIADLSLYLAAVDHIADLGANALLVFSPMLQQQVNSNEIRFVPEKCATDEQLMAIFQHARQRGLLTTLLPIVLIEKPVNKDWRGVIRPSNWDQWWESYDAFTDRFVNIAVKADVDVLVIGSELNSTEDQIDRWSRVIKRVREKFTGQIAYSANWDRYEKITFWPLVDVLCVSSYFELERENPEATEGQLVRAWGRERDVLLKFARRLAKPLLLSEVGYPSLPWASAHPWNYVTANGERADHEAQARCWRAFFKAWSAVFADEDEPAAGFFGYFWSPYHRGDAWDTGYGIQGKPAYNVVKAGFARIRSAAQHKHEN
jgi:hypothetical protein